LACNHRGARETTQNKKKKKNKKNRHQRQKGSAQKKAPTKSSPKKSPRYHEKIFLLAPNEETEKVGRPIKKGGPPERDFERKRETFNNSSSATMSPNKPRGWEKRRKKKRKKETFEKVKKKLGKNLRIGQAFWGGEGLETWGKAPPHKVKNMSAAGFAPPPKW